MEEEKRVHNQHVSMFIAYNSEENIYSMNWFINDETLKAAVREIEPEHPEQAKAMIEKNVIFQWHISPEGFETLSNNMIREIKNYNLRAAKKYEESLKSADPVELTQEKVVERD